jgi:hypothetical protein
MPRDDKPVEVRRCRKFGCLHIISAAIVGRQC